MQSPGAAYAPKLTAISVSSSYRGGTVRDKLQDDAALVAYCWRRYTYGDRLETALRIADAEKTDKIKEYKHILTPENIRNYCEDIFSAYLRKGQNFSDSLSPPKELKSLAAYMFEKFDKRQS